MSSTVECRWQRTYSQTGPAYLVTLHVGVGHNELGGSINAMWPQNRATVDDFGNLVLMRAWA